MRIYIKAGQEFQLSYMAPVRVGKSGTCADLILDCKANRLANIRGDGFDEGMGSIEVEDQLFVVYFDLDSGRFWYNNEWKNCA